MIQPVCKFDIVSFQKVEQLLAEGADPNIQLTTGLFRGCMI